VVPVPPVNGAPVKLRAGLEATPALVLLNCPTRAILETFRVLVPDIVIAVAAVDPLCENVRVEVPFAPAAKDDPTVQVSCADAAPVQ